MRALALIDGEHYPDVVRDALAALPYEVVGAVLLGGSEKLRDGDAEYGVPLLDDLATALAAAEADVVLDLSDEPVVGPRRRFRLASQVLAAGLPYLGADFRLDPVAFAPLDRPALAVVGSGKRVGKTAVAGHVARLLSASREVVVVAMGRGGPAEPVVSEASPTTEDLLARSRAGEHAASDYLEDAALAGVVTVGARRCGGGLAGRPFFSNVEEAARLAASLGPDLVLLEGSGAALPPVEAARRILVAGAQQDPEVVAGYLGAYRLLLSDLVVLTGCEEPLATAAAVEAVRAAIADVDPELPVVATVLRPRPVEAVAGRRVAFFSTAPRAIHERLRQHLEDEHGAEVVLVSGSLADRAALGVELDSEEGRRAELFLVEIKAAAIDVVAEAAAERGIPLVFADNEVLPLAGERDLDGLLLALADAVVAEGVAA
ncbi:MAG TPA: 2,3-diphosphoglycerate synthetase [Gaiellaceae bacterium]|nr:2,3-diphosphoglycerate synthetase [Gaiellaceae bacterium]